MNKDELNLFLDAIGSTVESLEFFRDRCLEHGFTRAETISLCKTYLTTVLNMGDSNYED